MALRILEEGIKRYIKEVNYLRIERDPETNGVDLKEIDAYIKNKHNLPDNVLIVKVFNKDEKNEDYLDVSYTFFEGGNINEKGI